MSMLMLYPHRFVGVFADVEGSIIAVAGTAEKGKLDTKVTVMTPGGHSSIPPVYTVNMPSSPMNFILYVSQGIGILARLLVEYEANPIEPLLEPGTPVYSIVQCVGEHAKGIPESLRSLIELSLTSDTALHQLEALLTTQPTYRALPRRPLPSCKAGSKSTRCPKKLGPS